MVRNNFYTADFLVDNLYDMVVIIFIIYGVEHEGISN